MAVVGEGPTQRKAESVYNLSLAMARRDFTHVAHLLTTARHGLAVCFMNYAEFAAAAHGTDAHAPLPLDRPSFDLLMAAVPATWHRVVQQEAARLRGQSFVDLAAVLRTTNPLPDEWVRSADGLI